MTIWDLRKVLATGSNQRPRIVCTNDSLHKNGIFCADVKSNVLVTASKDKTVSYCNITESEGIVPVRWLSGLHRRNHREGYALEALLEKKTSNI